MKIEISQYDPKLTLDPSDLLTIVHRAEDLGFDGIGIPDLLRYGFDTLTFFALALAKTDAITLFPAVGNPITRSPWVLANISATLGRIAPGRFRLTLGAGTRLNMGRRPAKIAEMRDSVSTIRALLSGESVPLMAKELGGHLLEQPPVNPADPYDAFHTSGLIRPPLNHIPSVCVAAGGPRMMELAGEVADEAMILTGHDSATVSTARTLIQKGAERSGRSLDTFKIAHWAFVYVDDDEEAAYQYFIRKFRTYPIGTHVNTLSMEALGFDWDLDRREDIPDEQWRRFIDAVAFAGPAGKIAERFQDVARAGRLDSIVCGIDGPDTEVALYDFARTVIPKIK